MEMFVIVPLKASMVEPSCNFSNTLLTITGNKTTDSYISAAGWYGYSRTTILLYTMKLAIQRKKILGENLPVTKMFFLREFDFADQKFH